ncbi:MAG: PQQ-binding-like beta-propeller repeat protein [Candidatus Promineifilaceae bacterium]
MDVNFRPSRRPLIFLLLLVALFTAACGAQTGGLNWPGLSADSDTLYFANGSELIALDAGNQQIKWRLAAASSTASLLAAPEVTDNRIYIGDYGLSQGLFSPGVKSSIFSIDKSVSGELVVGDSNIIQNENVGSDRIVATPLRADDKLFVGTANNYLLALDSETLSIIWGDDEPKFDHSIWGQPAYADGTVVATSLDKTVRAFDSDSGSELWSNELTGAIAASPLIVDGLVVVASFDSTVHAFDLQSGTERWTVEAANWIWNAPVVNGDSLFFGDTDGVVYAVDIAKGSIVWESQQDGIVQAPLATDGDQLIVPLVIGVSTDEQTGKLVSLSTSDGSLQWQQDMVLPTFAQPAIVQDSIVVILTDISTQQSSSSLQAFNLASGAKGWSWSQE